MQMTDKILLKYLTDRCNMIWLVGALLFCLQFKLFILLTALKLIFLRLQF